MSLIDEVKLEQVKSDCLLERWNTRTKLRVSYFEIKQ